VTACPAESAGLAGSLADRRNTGCVPPEPTQDELFRRSAKGPASPADSASDDKEIS